MRETLRTNNSYQPTGNTNSNYTPLPQRRTPPQHLSSSIPTKLTQQNNNDTFESRPQRNIEYLTEMQDQIMQASQQTQSSINSSYITPAQRTNKKTTTPQPRKAQAGSDITDQEEELLLSQIPSNQNTYAQMLKQNKARYKEMNQKQDQTMPNLNIKAIIIQFLPILIRLLLATNITEKVECIMELGNELEIEEPTQQLLNKIGLTLLSSSQLN